MMTSQSTLMAESIAVDGSQQVRGAEDARVSNIQRVQGSGSIAGAFVHGAAEEVVLSGTVGGSSEMADERASGTQETSKSRRKRSKSKAKGAKPGDQRGTRR